MKTWNNTEHIITFSCTSLTKRWIERAQAGPSLHVPSPTHLSPSNSADCCSCFVSVYAFLIMVLSFGGTCPRSATMMNGSWWTSASCVRWVSHWHHAGRAGVIKLGQRSRKNRWRTLKIQSVQSTKVGLCETNIPMMCIVQQSNDELLGSTYLLEIFIYLHTPGAII